MSKQCDFYKVNSKADNVTQRLNLVTSGMLKIHWIHHTCNAL